MFHIYGYHFDLVPRDASTIINQLGVHYWEMYLSTQKWTLYYYFFSKERKKKNHKALISFFLGWCLFFLSLFPLSTSYALPPHSITSFEYFTEKRRYICQSSYCFTNWTTAICFSIYNMFLPRSKAFDQ